MTTFLLNEHRFWIYLCKFVAKLEHGMERKRKKRLKV